MVSGFLARNLMCGCCGQSRAGRRQKFRAVRGERGKGSHAGRGRSSKRQVFGCHSCSREGAKE